MDNGIFENILLLNLIRDVIKNILYNATHAKKIKKTYFLFVSIETIINY